LSMLTYRDYFANDNICHW